MPSSGYFAPTYFAPDYFGSPGATAPGGGGSFMIAYRDRDAFAAILQTLKDTGEFADVLFPAPLDAAPVGADRAPLAVVVPIRWVEESDVSSDALLRRVSYDLVLVARAEDPRDRFETLDRLTSVVQNAVEGSTLGGACPNRSSRLRHGQYDSKARHPETRLTIDGAFSYWIETPNAHNTSR